MRPDVRRILLRKTWVRAHHGQAIVEFAFALPIFLMVVFGTVDFGRVIFTYAELVNGVREGARYGKVHCSETDAIKSVVIDRAPGLGLTPADVTVGNVGGCAPPAGKLTVGATTTFTTVTQNFLGIGPLGLSASATVDVE
jgi:Flp pilus assembly protein TadG